MGKVKQTVMTAGIIASLVTPFAAPLQAHAVATGPSTTVASQRVVFDRWTGAEPMTSSEIVMRNLDGSNEKVLFTSPDPATKGAYRPVFSADGSKVYFQLDTLDGSNSDIYSVNVDGTGATNLTNTPTIKEQHPSTNGANADVLYTSTEGTVSHIYKAAGGNFASKSQLTTVANSQESFPRYSPDGEKIAYIRKDSSNGYSVSVMNKDGSSSKDIQTNVSLSGNLPNPYIFKSLSNYVMFWADAPNVLPLNALSTTPGKYAVLDATTNALFSNTSIMNNTTYSTMFSQKSSATLMNGASTQAAYIFKSPTDQIMYQIDINDVEGTPAVLNKANEQIYSASLDYSTGGYDTVATNAAGGNDLTISSDRGADTYNVYDKDTLTLADGAKSGYITVQSGGTLKGKGTAAGIGVMQGGHLNPGMSPGCITSSSDVDIAGSFDVEIGGTTECTGYDQLAVTGDVDVTGGTLTAARYNGFTPTVGQVFTIIKATSVTGTFAGLADGATLTQDGISYRVNYTGTTVTLTVTGVKAPNTGYSLGLANPAVTAVAATGFVGGLIALRRRLFN